MTSIWCHKFVKIIDAFQILKDKWILFDAIDSKLIFPQIKNNILIKICVNFIEISSTY